MDTPQSIATNGIIALTLLICATPFILIALVALWVGSARWPGFVRTEWQRIPEWTRAITRRLMPLAWLLVGIFVGSSLINPIARWLRMLMP